LIEDCTLLPFFGQRGRGGKERRSCVLCNRACNKTKEKKKGEEKKGNSVYSSKIGRMWRNRRCWRWVRKREKKRKKKEKRDFAASPVLLKTENHNFLAAFSQNGTTTGK